MSDAIETVPIGELELDVENPRLPEFLGRTPEEITEYIASATAIEELMGAIAENGYFPGEPVIAYRKEEGGPLIVIEGNRRLTAVKLLQDISLIANPSQRMRDIVENANHHPTKIPVIVKPDRASVMPYLGFRHITGVKQWDPLSKARYMKQLFDVTKGDSSPIDRYREIALRIGSRYDYIKRNLDALAVYRVMEENSFFNIDDLGESSVKFGVLFTALANKSIGAYVGVRQPGNNGEDYVENDPIINFSMLSVKRLRHLAKWLYEKDSETGATIVGESRNLSMLSTVLDSEKSIKLLVDGSSLDYAYRHTKGLQKDFKELLFEINGQCEEALGMTGNIEWDEDAFQVAKEINQTMQQIGKSLVRKKSVESDVFD